MESLAFVGYNNIEHVKKMRMLLRKINTRLLIKFPR